MDPSRSQHRLRPTTSSSSLQDIETDVASCAVNFNDYTHSPPHLYVAKNDLTVLRQLLSFLSGEALSSAIDRRDVLRGETPLHLAVRLGRHSAAAALLSAGADPSLQDAAGWTPFQESLLLRRPRSLSLLLLRHHHLSALRKWRQRLPSVVSALRHVPDFYLELSFRFESSVVPPFLLARAAPSDTYRIWKRGASVRADTSLAGFDVLRVSRADRTFLFLGDGSASDAPRSVDPGSLLVLDRGRKEVRDALEGVSAAVGENGPAAMTAEEEEEMVGEEAAARVYRPGVDITKAEVVPRTNWWRKEKLEMVGEWKAKVYDLDNVFFTLKTRKAVRLCQPDSNRKANPRDMELALVDDEGFLVAEMAPPRGTKAAVRAPVPVPPRHSCCEPLQRGSGVKDLEYGFDGRRRRRKSVDIAPLQFELERRWDVEEGNYCTSTSTTAKGKETVKSLRPTVWLTEDFPLKTEEVVPLLDVLADKVKAVRRIRELLAAKFPPSTFPVKLSIPVIPTVRVVVTFSKFIELPPPKEQFFTPPSSPRQLAEEEDEHPKAGQGNKSSWLRWTTSTSTKSSSSARVKAVSPTPQASDLADPFSIPEDYTWVSSRMKNLKKNKSKRGSHKGRVLAL